MKKKGVRRYYKDKNALKQIGNKMREIRISKEISQENLANECDIDYSQVNRMELRKVNLVFHIYTSLLKHYRYILKNYYNSYLRIFGSYDSLSVLFFYSNIF